MGRQARQMGDVGCSTPLWATHNAWECVGLGCSQPQNAAATFWGLCCQSSGMVFSNLIALEMCRDPDLSFLLEQMRIRTCPALLGCGGGGKKSQKERQNLINLVLYIDDDI